MDSPEFESSKGSGRVDISESTFKVTICAAGSYLMSNILINFQKTFTNQKKDLNLGFPKMLLETNQLKWQEIKNVIK